jgi:hypothetical protein
MNRALDASILPLFISIEFLDPDILDSIVAEYRVWASVCTSLRYMTVLVKVIIFVI